MKNKKQILRLLVITNQQLLLFAVALLLGIQSYAQTGIAINNTGADPASSALLDLSSTTKGFLPPRMTYFERVAIASPPAGLIVWCSSCGTSGELQVYNGTVWTNVTGGAVSASVPGAPTIGTAIAGNAQASVPFTSPASNGGSAITSYTATSNPDNITGTLTQAASGTITVTGLTNGTAYTFTVTATNAIGTGAASAASNSVMFSPYVLGQSFGGGKIFYIDGTGLHGLICATSDQSTGIIWAIEAYQYTSVPGTLTTIGSGSANTDKIIAQNGADITYAAGLARSYTGGGYSDWFLPSKDELNQMYVQRVAIGGFVSNNYWSSSEYLGSLVWYQNFTNAGQLYYYKFSTYYVRPVRAF